MIQLQQVSKRFPTDKDALVNISLNINAGELIVLDGPSGSGKTTLLRLLAAIERPSAGAVLVGGQNLSRLSRSALPYVRRKLGLVFQDQKLLFDRTVFHNVMLPLTIIGFPPKEAARRVEAALNKVGLQARARDLPLALSGGERQRLAIARAVVHRPHILLADEPTAHLDALSARAVARILLEFHAVGVTVLCATYDPMLFPKARRLMLENGRLR